MVQFMPLPALAFPQNAMINFSPMNQSLQFMAQNNLARAQFGLAENADQRAQEMHPLQMDQTRAQTGLIGAQTQASVGGERRADAMHPLQMAYQRAQTGLVGTQAASMRDANTRATELHPYQVVQHYWAAQRPPDQNALIGQILGVNTPVDPGPQAPWPTQYAGPRPAPPQAPAAPQGGPSVQGGITFNPNSPTWQPQGVPQAMPQPAAVQPGQMGQPGQGGTPWQSHPQQAAIAAGLATGRLTPQAAQMLASGPEWMGVPEAIRNHATTTALAAATAAQGAQATVANIDRLIEVAPQAYVGAGVEARTNIANVLQSLGLSPQWILNNQSLPATQLLRQGLAQFIGTEADKYRPVSNSDLAFIAQTVANPSMTRPALMEALAVARRVAQRQAVYEAARAEMLLRDPQAAARLPDLMARVLQAFPQGSQPAQGGQTATSGAQPQGGQPAGAPTQAQPAAPDARWNNLALSDDQKREALRRVITSNSPEVWQEFRRVFGDGAYHAARREFARMRQFGGQQASP